MTIPARSQPDGGNAQVRTAIHQTLTWPEALQAAMGGVMRQVLNLKAGRRHRFGANEAQAWDRHIEGAAGELAVAKTLGIYWPGVGRLGGPDVGTLQVRTARPGGRLIVHPSDADTDVFILVTGYLPEFTVQGWLYGHEAKNNAYWDDPTGTERDAFFVPAHALRDMTTVPHRVVELEAQPARV